MDRRWSVLESKEKQWARGTEGHGEEWRCDFM